MSPDPSAPLTAHDRCDHRDCSAQAYVRFTLRSGGDLIFCAHHANSHRDAIVPRTSHILDQSDDLLPESKRQAPEPSAEKEVRRLRERAGGSVHPSDVEDDDDDEDSDGLVPD